MRSILLSMVGIVVSTIGSGHALARQNQPPATPMVTEPAFDGRVVNAADVHMESSLFSDPNPGDAHRCTDWEIWTTDPAERVWVTSCITGVERLHTHLGDGEFENSHEGRRSLFPERSYRLRVRHRDDSNMANSWSGWGERLFLTAPPTRINPLELADILASPRPQWVVGTQNVILGPGQPGAFLRLENSLGEPLAEIRSLNESANEEIDYPVLSGHHPLRVRISSGGLAGGLVVAESVLRFYADEDDERVIYLPTVVLSPGTEVTYWISASGASYLGDASQTEPDFSTLMRGPPVPWQPAEGYKVEVVASGLTLPVNIAFVPNPLPGPDAPLYYITELYGTIKVVLRDGSVHDFATNLLNFPPTGNFPGSGEQGLTGIAVEPGTNTVYAAMLYEVPAGFHFPKVVRFESTDGGRTASSQTTILDMFGEHQGQSHQISNLSFGPDNKLYVHMGDGFYHLTALDLESFRGKILRVNPDGSAPADNPFYNENDGFSARDYVYAYGLRNPFGGGWRLSDGRHYEVENGPGVDRFARVDPGASFGYDGTDESMMIRAIHNWSPPTAPVNIAFVEPAVFGGSGFPANQMGNAFVTLSGPTWVAGPWLVAKRIVPFVLDAEGNVVSQQAPLVNYIGTGHATTCGLAAGPDGLYFTDLYEDSGANGAVATGSNVLRIRYVGVAKFHADIRRGPAPLPIRFTDISQVPEPTNWEWDFGDGSRSNERHPVHVYTKPGIYNVRLAVSSGSDPVVTQRNQYIEVTPDLRVAYIGGTATPSQTDTAVMAALSERGFTVQYYEDDQPGRLRGEALARDRNLVVISSSMQSALVLAEFRNVQTPVMFWEQTLLWPNYEGLSSTSALVQNQTSVRIVDNSHPITVGINHGPLQMYTSGRAMNTGLAPFPAGLRVLAERDDSSGDLTLGVAETGGPLLDDPFYGSRVAAGRRLFMFLDDLTFPHLTPSGRTLFDRSVCWVSGIGAEVLAGPVDTVGRAGESITLTTVARGVGPIQYLWRKNGLPIAGSSGPSLTIVGAMTSDSGNYDVVAIGQCNSAYSSTAVVTVLCGGDFNQDDAVNSQDFFDFLTCFFEPGCPRADFTGDGVVNTQDFFDFINAFFTPCSH